MYRDRRSAHSAPARAHERCENELASTGLKIVSPSEAKHKK